jgi:uncharacterized protein YaaW (UPF0174 family)
MSETVEIEYVLTVQTEQMETQLRQLETLGFRTLHMLRQLGLPPEADAAIQKMQQLMSVIRMLDLSLRLLESASGPIGWALFAVSAVSTALTVGNTLYNGSRGY